MSQSPTVPPIVNRAMRFVLRSPLHAVVSNNTLLITFTGRKTGKSYTTPVSYAQCGRQLVIFTHAGWWKNLRGGAPVTLRLRGQEVHGRAEPIASDQHAIAAGLADYLRQVPRDAPFYGVTFDDQANPKADEVERAAHTVVMISVQLC